MKYLVTGDCGFIGYYVCKRLLSNTNAEVIGIDNMNSYYDVSLKQYRLFHLNKYSNFTHIDGDISDKNFILTTFEQYKPQYIINLAAQAGVRYSIENPDVYISSNIVGFYNILEACRSFKISHLVFASSSSVYGDSNNIPYSINDKTDSPVSLYAATKKSDELLAYAYSKLYNIPITGTRFFTVYGPAGRPDMAYFDFTKTLINGGTIKIFNNGNCKRDFTYIDDVVEAISRIIHHPPLQNAPHFKVYNIGHGEPVDLLEFVTTLQQELVQVGLLPNDYNFKDHQQLLPMQPGDMTVTYADTSELEHDFNYKPTTSLQEGLHDFVSWYKSYYSEEK